MNKYTTIKYRTPFATAFNVLKRRHLGFTIRGGGPSNARYPMGHKMSQGARKHSFHPVEVPRGVVACVPTGRDYHEALALDELESSKYHIRRVWVDNRRHRSYGLGTQRSRKP